VKKVKVPIGFTPNSERKKKDMILTLVLLLSLEELVLLAAPGDFRPEPFISGSGVLVPLPRFGRFLAFY
jgi:hypothetical protein